MSLKTDGFPAALAHAQPMHFRAHVRHRGPHGVYRNVIHAGVVGHRACGFEAAAARSLVAQHDVVRT